MGGFLVAGVGVVAMFIFSVCLFFSSGLSIFWLFLELGTLSLIPCFFVYVGDSVMSSLFSYLIVSGISSSLIVSGLLFENIFVMSYLGLMVKLGFFPFFGWVYSVVLGSNWLVIWGISSILKVPFLFLCFFMSFGGGWLLDFAGLIGFLLLGLMFWVSSVGWDSCWCHMMLSSSASFVLMSVVISSENLFGLFCIYFVWASAVVLFFWWSGICEWSLGCWFLFIFLLVSMPASFSIFYKLVVGFNMYACSLIVLVGWVFYGISEQFYFLNYLVGRAIPRSLFNVRSAV